MAAWTADELARVGDAEELAPASLREDGTLRPPTIVPSIVAPDAPAATLQLVPRPEETT
jgi:hypothetical protein